MALRSNLVNLDAMIKREDFAASDTEPSSFENVSTISLRDFTKGGLIGPSLENQTSSEKQTTGRQIKLFHCLNAS